MELFNMFKNELVGEQTQQAQTENMPQGQFGNLPSAPISEVANATGADRGLVGKIMSMGLPLIMGQLDRNTNDPQGSKSLFDALTRHENADYSNPQNIDPEDGNKILGHIFGNNKDTVSKKIGNQVGADQDQVKKILMYLAPLALAYLANKKRTGQLNEKNISDYTRDEAQQFDTQTGGALGNILGNVLNGGQEEDNQSQGGGLFDMIGKLFGGK